MEEIQSCLSLRNINFSIKSKPILSNITMDILQGKTTGILGQNGAGKSTLLQILMGLKKQTTGEIRYANPNVSFGSKAFRQQLGVVFQETALYDELTVYANLAYIASLYGVPNPKKRIDEVLGIFEMSDKSNILVSSLSGGFQRRVTIARALMHSPTLLIIDEPTLGVDAQARHVIWSYLRYLKSIGTTIIISTNYFDEVVALCDSVSILSHGNLILSGETSESVLQTVGDCLDIVTEEHISERLLQDFRKLDGVERITKSSEGFFLFYNGKTNQNTLLEQILKKIKIKEFKHRNPDLSEVFFLYEKKST